MVATQSSFTFILLSLLININLYLVLQFKNVGQSNKSKTQAAVKVNDAWWESHLSGSESLSSACWGMFIWFRTFRSRELLLRGTVCPPVDRALETNHKQEASKCILLLYRDDLYPLMTNTARPLMHCSVWAQRPGLPQLTPLAARCDAFSLGRCLTSLCPSPPPSAGGRGRLRGRRRLKDSVHRDRPARRQRAQLPGPHGRGNGRFHFTSGRTLTF